MTVLYKPRSLINLIMCFSFKKKSQKTWAHIPKTSRRKKRYSRRYEQETLIWLTLRDSQLNTKKINWIKSVPLES